MMVRVPATGVSEHASRQVRGGDVDRSAIGVYTVCNTPATPLGLRVNAHLGQVFLLPMTQEESS